MASVGPEPKPTQRLISELSDAELSEACDEFIHAAVNAHHAHMRELGIGLALVLEVVRRRDRAPL